jgi:hypothetical protein
LTQGSGLAFRSVKKSALQPLKLIDSSWTRSEWLDVGDSHECSRVALTSPLRLVSNGALDTQCHSFLPSIARRVCGLAIWSGCAVQNADEAAIQSATAGRVTGSALTPQMWTRNSKRQSIRQAHIGLTGELLVTNLNSLGHALIVAGQHVGAGSEVSLGLGRYEILN